MLIGHELPAPGCAQSGTEFVPAVPRKVVVQGRANDRMPKRVACNPFLQETHLQRAIKRIEEHRNGDRWFQCRCPSA
jgi:hypothetical protein